MEKKNESSHLTATEEVRESTIIYHYYEESIDTNTNKYTELKELLVHQIQRSTAYDWLNNNYQI